MAGMATMAARRRGSKSGIGVANLMANVYYVADGNNANSSVFNTASNIYVMALFTIVINYVCNRNNENIMAKSIIKVHSCGVMKKANLLKIMA